MGCPFLAYINSLIGESSEKLINGIRQKETASDKVVFNICTKFDNVLHAPLTIGKVFSKR